MLRDRRPVCLSVTLVYCSRTVGWIKMPLGTEVGLGPGDIVLDGDPAPPWKGAQQLPTFRPMSIVAKRLPISATAELLSRNAVVPQPQIIDQSRLLQSLANYVNTVLTSDLGINRLMVTHRTGCCAQVGLYIFSAYDRPA